MEQDALAEECESRATESSPKAPPVAPWVFRLTGDPKVSVIRAPARPASARPTETKVDRSRSVRRPNRRVSPGTCSASVLRSQDSSAQTKCRTRNDTTANLPPSVFWRLLPSLSRSRVGSRLAAALHIEVSRTTLLRAVMALPDPARTVPRVMGTDDFATRRGQHYGTVLIDCETGQPLDLPSGRDAAT
ncbi:hypothetical protein ACIQMV_39235, partial [Streptomyces sp. NPDC091412]